MSGHNICFHLEIRKIISELSSVLPLICSSVHGKKIRRFYGKIPGIQLPVHFPLFLRAFACRKNIFRNQDMVGLCKLTTPKNTFVGFKGYMTKSNTYLFAAVLCLSPENVYGRP